MWGGVGVREGMLCGGKKGDNREGRCGDGGTCPPPLLSPFHPFRFSLSRTLPTFPSSIIDDFTNLQFPPRLSDPDLFFPRYFLGNVKGKGKERNQGAEIDQKGNTPNLLPLRVNQRP